MWAERRWISGKRSNLLNYRRKEVGFVVQYFALIEDMNIYKNVALPLKYQGMGSGKIRKKTMGMLERLGIADKAKAYPSELVRRAAAEGGHCPGPGEGRGHYPGGRAYRGTG